MLNLILHFSVFKTFTTILILTPQLNYFHNIFSLRNHPHFVKTLIESMNLISGDLKSVNEKSKTLFSHCVFLNLASIFGHINNSKVWSIELAIFNGLKLLTTMKQRFGYFLNLLLKDSWKIVWKSRFAVTTTKRINQFLCLGMLAVAQNLTLKLFRALTFPFS